MEVGKRTLRIERGIHRCWPSGGEALRDRQESPAGIGTNTVRREHFVSEAAVVEPFSYLATRTSPEQLLTACDVLDDLRCRLADRARLRPWRSRELFEVCVVVGKPADGIADRHTVGDDDGFDGSTAMPARPAPPPLDTTPVGEHLDRRVLVGMGGFTFLKRLGVS